MQADYEKQLERAVRRELDGLGDLTAPPGLAERVMRRVELERAHAPWYRRAWPAWPLALRMASILVLATALGAVCFGIMQATQTSLFASISHTVGETLGRFGLIQRTLGLLASSARLALGSLGTLCIAILVMVAVLCYAVCVGVGTVYYRLAFVRRQSGEVL